jgi:hypothetical protein
MKLAALDSIILSRQSSEDADTDFNEDDFSAATALGECAANNINDIISELDKYGEELVSCRNATGEAFKRLPLYKGASIAVFIELSEAGSRRMRFVRKLSSQILIALGGALEVKRMDVLAEKGHGAHIEQEHTMVCMSANFEPIDKERPLPGCVRVRDKSVIQYPRVGLLAKDAGFAIKSATDAVVLSLEIIEQPNAISQYFIWNKSRYQPACVGGMPHASTKLTGGGQLNVFKARVQKIILDSINKHVECLNIAPNLIRDALLDAMKQRCHHLQACIKARKGKQLFPQDLVLIKSIGEAIEVYIYAGGMLDIIPGAVHAIKNDDVVVMWRKVLFDSKDVQIRLHMFPNAAETYIHNHRGNLVSMCLHGTYTHCTWNVCGEGEHNECERDPTGTLSTRVRKPGSLQVAGMFQHVPGHAYYLNSEAYHTVKVDAVPAVGTSNKPVGETLTLFVKDKLCPSVGPGKVLEQVQQDENAERAPVVLNSSENLLEGAERDEVVKRMQAYLMAAGELSATGKT